MKKLCDIHTCLSRGCKELKRKKVCQESTLFFGNSDIFSKIHLVGNQRTTEKLVTLDTNFLGQGLVKRGDFFEGLSACGIINKYEMVCTRVEAVPEACKGLLSAYINHCENYFSFWKIKLHDTHICSNRCGITLTKLVRMIPSNKTALSGVWRTNNYCLVEFCSQ